MARVLLDHGVDFMVGQANVGVQGHQAAIHVGKGGVHGFEGGQDVADTGAKTLTAQQRQKRGGATTHQKKSVDATPQRFLVSIVSVVSSGLGAIVSVVSSGLGAGATRPAPNQPQQEAEEEIRPNCIYGGAVEQHDEIVLVEKIELVVVGRRKRSGGVGQRIKNSRWHEPRHAVEGLQ